MFFKILAYFLFVVGVGNSIVDGLNFLHFTDQSVFDEKFYLGSIASGIMYLVYKKRDD